MRTLFVVIRWPLINIGLQLQHCSVDFPTERSLKKTTPALLSLMAWVM
jgi:hypothetical protein